MNFDDITQSQPPSAVPVPSPESEATELPRPQPPAPPEPGSAEPHSEHEERSTEIASDEKPAFDRKKLLLLGGSLLAAVLFFALTAIFGKTHSKQTGVANQTSHKTDQAGKSQGSVTPLMDPIHKSDQNANDGQLSANDIKRMRAQGSQNANSASGASQKQVSPTSKGNENLASVPSFADTQQKWEEPRPYGGSSEPNSQQNQQQQSALRETSIVFVRNQTQPSVTSRESSDSDDEPVLDMAPGSRVLAKLEAEISTSDPSTVVAEVEYTYAIGDQIVVPSGARVFGQVTNADSSGNVGVKFTEIDLLDGRKEKIDAIGKALDMGPIKGKVSGKNAGKNLLVRSVSGIGSTLAMVLGTNTSSAFSEDDLIRQRLAENIGSAGDNEIMNMALNSHQVVSVPVDRKVYIVFTKHSQAPSTLHKVTAPSQ